MILAGVQVDAIHPPRKASKPVSKPAPKPEPVVVDRSGDRCDDQRLRLLERILIVVECLAPIRPGATVAEVTADVADILGDAWSHRTIQRDLDALERLGIVEAVATGKQQPLRWRFVDRSIRSAVIGKIAEARAEDRY